jgi:hypothetical protein
MTTVAPQSNAKSIDRLAQCNCLIIAANEGRLDHHEGPQGRWHSLERKSAACANISSVIRLLSFARISSSAISNPIAISNVGAEELQSSAAPKQIANFNRRFADECGVAFDYHTLRTATRLAPRFPKSPSGGMARGSKKLPAL